MLAVAGLAALSGCASLLQGEPRSDIAVARYTFSGSIFGSETRLAPSSRSFESVQRRFAGNVIVYSDGRARLSSTHGSCDGGRVVGDQINITCNNLRVHVGPNGGMAYVPVRERYEARSATCAEYAPANTAPGTYRLVAGLYDPVSGRRVGGESSAAAAGSITIP